MTADDAQFGDGGISRFTLQMTIHSGAFQPLLQLHGGRILSRQPQEGNLPTQRGDIDRHIPGASRSSILVPHMHHGHGRFR